MNLDNVKVADIEADALLDDVTKIHVLSWSEKSDNGNWIIKSTNDMNLIKQMFANKENVFVMHNGRRYDSPVITKILGVKVEATIIDSLSLSWWLYPARVRAFGLEAFGEDLGIAKPKVDDWKNLSYEEYRHRCEEDVKINLKLWEALLKKGRKFYKDDEFIRLINILNFIMDCSFHQEDQKVKVDVDKTKYNLAYFELMKEEKVEALTKAMPKDIKYGTKVRPTSVQKKDGSLSVAGEKWFARLKELGLPKNTQQFEDIISEKEPNPNSALQKKKWLYSLGWIPETYKYTRDKETGEVSKVEQILNPDTKELCPSVKKLVEVEPAIEILDGLTVLTHRIGILKGFLDKMDENEMISQGLSRLAVTMRWQHAVVVNIPKVTGKGDIRDGKWLRECLIAQEGTRLVQADLSGVESKTSDHYTFKLNKERISKTQQPFFDAHTEISVVANLMTPEEEAFYVFTSVVKDLKSAGEPYEHLDYKNFSIYPYNTEVQRLHDLPEEAKKKKMQELKNARGKGKTTNYASLYLVGADTLSRNLGISKKEAKGLIDAYWKVHWAVKQVTTTFKTKQVGDETWIFNPVSKFWYYLRNDKDKFSVINQSTAVYCFNMWILFVTKRLGFPITQTHDDLMLRVKDDDAVATDAMSKLKLAMDDVNKHLQLNVELGCEVQSGYTFAETH